MAGFKFKTTMEELPEAGIRTAITDTASKTLMLVGERNDEVSIESVNEILTENESIPKTIRIRQRTTTYYGPKLLVVDQKNREYLITAPGPDCDLMLWGEKTDAGGVREYWFKMAEITASLKDTQKNYEVCPQCNEPIKTADHERMAAVGHCPNQ